MPYFQARDGARLHYLDIGRGPACVMLHAFGMRAAMWLPFVLPFAARRRFVMLDFRGFGGSRGLRHSGNDALRQNADDLHDLLQQLKLDRPRMVGFSIGAACGLEYQRRYGFDQLSAYLHIDQTPCIANGGDWSWGLMGVQNEQAFANARELLAAFDPIDRDTLFHELPPALQQQFWDWFGEFFGSCIGHPVLKRVFRLAGGRRPGSHLLRADDWPIYLDCVRSFTVQDYDFRESLRRVRIPFWVLLGRNSAVFPPEGQRRIADYVSDTRVIEFRHCGHIVPVEAPARFLYTLGRFLAAPVARPGCASQPEPAL
ncbi:alpha/beta hydrolase [Solimonas sp. K1W22B-7]|uniref:alpha/beta fold hydrolase n=1 Tax=Solimonas sp. K1W22B-7 TaxID=2303331 RepID=UPI000E33349B|nr:alpha/beta hydrolase [Solimonas sp. K1W22B-7]AXQ28287.1 alpha/beta hydrolase [Solimonas sp. K1W22B-7]